MHSSANDAARAWFRRRAKTRLPAETRQQLLDAISACKPLGVVLCDLDLTSNQVWGLTKTPGVGAALESGEAWQRALHRLCEADEESNDLAG
jgi:hypothetical protein